MHMASEFTVYRTPRRSLADASHAKQLAGVVGFLSTVVGMLLALGIIHPLGGTQDALAAAAVNTTDAGSAKVSMKMDVSSPAHPGTITGQGAFDFRTGRGRVTYHYPPGAVPWAAGPLDVETVFDGDASYQYLPMLSPERPWIRSDTSASDLQTDLDVFLALFPDDPSQILGFLEGGGDVQEIGDEPLLGAKTTHYRASIDIEDLLEQVPVAQQEELRPAVERITRSGGATVPVDVWVDDSDLIRRMGLEGRLGGVPGTATMTVDLFDFGTAVDAELPPPNKVWAET
jgi:hypothetical protein